VPLLIERERYDVLYEYLQGVKSEDLRGELIESHDIELGQGEMKLIINQSTRLAVRIDTLETQLDSLQADTTINHYEVDTLFIQLAELKENYYKLAAQIRTDPDYAFTIGVSPTDIGGLRSKLAEGHSLLMAYSAEDQLLLFHVSKDGYNVRSVPVPRDSLDSLITRCRELCFDRGYSLLRKGKILDWDWEDDGSEFYATEVTPLKDALATLYEHLIRPFETELKESDIVSFIPSGNIYYVPWGALIDEEKDSTVFVSELYNWNILTSTDFFDCIYNRAEGKSKIPDKMLLVGNPAGIGTPLEFAEEEVIAIQGSYPNSTTLTGQDATEPGVQSSVLQNEVLHLATHCDLNPEDPWNSCIRLAPTDSSDGKWTVVEVTGQTWENVQLVTLSACETALGGEKPGLEFESMAKAFSLAMEGPPAIVATLWSVFDPSTKEFMVTFYDELKDNPKSEALRLAQQKLIHSEYAHPFFWAPFILIGEWR
ncbi:CHAT domain-containing protein, partial [candidate division WOR-3 bacterium]|nr:CHAT domain-containing protein [candidate division WOR-3 bacterium]MBD3363702.1 CHAT domain-containing protein [candidate division WOR-3 bacterium]